MRLTQFHGPKFIPHLTCIVATIWNLPGPPETTPGLPINNQLVILNLGSGRQISYTSPPLNGHGEVTCPQVLPGGIVANESPSRVTVTQAVAP
jgi:hypothetical protein